MTRKATEQVTTIGIDIGKNTFHLIGLDGAGNIVLHCKLSRSQVIVRLANLPPCLIGMEACVGAHHLSRQLQALGHDARLMPAQYVTPFLRGQKNDFRDAEAIAEAVQRRGAHVPALIVSRGGQHVVRVHGGGIHAYVDIDEQFGEVLQHALPVMGALVAGELIVRLQDRTLQSAVDGHLPALHGFFDHGLHLFYVEAGALLELVVVVVRAGFDDFLAVHEFTQPTGLHARRLARLHKIQQEGGFVAP